MVRPPTPESKQEEEVRERRRLSRKQGPYISPFAVAQTGLTNPTPVKTLLGT